MASVIKRSRVRLRKACDNCRRVKSKCEKTEGSPSCISCDERGVACIITSPATSKLPTYPLALELNTSTSSRVVLYDWIYGNTPSSDLLSDPRLAAHLGDDALRNHIGNALSSLARFDTIRCDVDFLPSIGSAGGFTQLPDECELLQIVLTFSESMSVAFPLFREYIIDWLANRPYLDPRMREDLPAWTSLNIVLAFGYRCQTLRYPNLGEIKGKCEMYLKNALKAIPSLIFGPASWANVEALLGMVLLMYCSVEYPLSHSLLAVAIRKARTLEGELVHPSNSENVVHERRERVFWVGYVLDTMTSSLQGLSPFQCDSNVDLGMPTDHLGSIGLPNGFQVLVGQHLCQLAVIKARIFQQLYSSGAHYDSRLIEDLSSQLRAWRKSVHPECESSLDAMEESSFSRLAITSLLLSYHHTVIILCRAEYLAHADAPKAQIPPLAACARSARKALRLTRYYPVYAPVGVRGVLNFAFTSFVALTMHILLEPGGASARSDLGILHEAFRFISNLVQVNSSSGVQGSQLASMLSICRWHMESAERAILSTEL
ncbi:hypothetical protein BJY04DRAFT_224495 [Aspergillus karnatakaensis]|uniref:uncharacterized protein n=1 Tax=Aspergillus karnatakaensis TaxID=1810916 RepID=UPI003CCCC9AB